MHQQIGRLDLPEIKQLVHQIQQTVCVALHDLQVLILLLPGILPQPLHASVYQRKRGADFMGDGCEETDFGLQDFFLFLSLLPPHPSPFSQGRLPADSPHGSHSCRHQRKRITSQRPSRQPDGRLDTYFQPGRMLAFAFRPSPVLCGSLQIKHIIAGRELSVVQTVLAAMCHPVIVQPFQPVTVTDIEQVVIRRHGKINAERSVVVFQQQLVYKQRRLIKRLSLAFLRLFLLKELQPREECLQRRCAALDLLGHKRDKPFRSPQVECPLPVAVTGIIAEAIRRQPVLFRKQRYASVGRTIAQESARSRDPQLSAAVFQNAVDNARRQLPHREGARGLACLAVAEKKAVALRAYPEALVGILEKGDDRLSHSKARRMNVSAGWPRKSALAQRADPHGSAGIFIKRMDKAMPHHPAERLVAGLPEEQAVHRPRQQASVRSLQQ